MTTETNALSSNDLLIGINAAIAGVQHMACELAMSEARLSMLAAATESDGKPMVERVCLRDRQALAEALLLIDNALQFVGNYLSDRDAVSEVDNELTDPVFAVVGRLRERCLAEGLCDSASPSS